MFEIERDIYGLSAEERLQIRRERSAPLLTDLEACFGRNLPGFHVRPT
nr:hypothetical protein [Bradyrhizobium yuanmingense]